MFPNKSATFEQEIKGPTRLNTELVAEPVPMPRCAGGFVPWYPGIFKDIDLHMKKESSGVHTWEQNQVCVCVLGGGEGEKGPHKCLASGPPQRGGYKTKLKTSCLGTFVALFQVLHGASDRDNLPFPLARESWEGGHSYVCPSRFSASVETGHSIGAGVKSALGDPCRQQGQS